MWEIECTGDYGLSDCLFITEEAWDFAEMAWQYRRCPQQYSRLQYERPDRSTKPVSVAGKVSGEREVLRLDRRKCIALFQGHKPALLYKLAPEELLDYGKLKSCRVIDYVPNWKQREDESAAQSKEPTAKPAVPAPVQQQESEAPPEINPSEDLEYQVETAAQSGNSGLGMVEFTIGGVCGEDDDNPPGS